MFSINKKMMMVALLVSLIGFAGKTAFSAEEKETGEASVRMGLAIPVVGDLKDVAGTGLAIGIQAMQHVSATGRFGADVSYISFGEESKDGVDTKVSIISTLILMQHDLATEGTVPFFEGGFGFARTQVNIAESIATGPAITKGSNEVDISPTLMFGFGVDMPISNNATFGVSMDYQHFFFKFGDVDGGGSLSFLAHLRV